MCLVFGVTTFCLTLVRSYAVVGRKQTSLQLKTFFITFSHLLSTFESKLIFICFDLITKMSLSKELPQSRQSLRQLFSKVNQNKRQSYNNRICDDLSEVLLQYLPLKDKLRYECVSKQFRNTIFQKQYVFDLKFLGYLFIKNTSLPIVRRIHYLICFKLILKKCPNLKTIVLRDEKLFVLTLKGVSNNCKNSPEIHLHFN